MGRYSGRTLVDQGAISNWGKTAPSSAVAWGAGTGGTTSTITVGANTYTLHTYTTDSTFVCTKAGKVEIFLVGGGGGAGFNFIGRTYGDSGGSGSGPVQCTMDLVTGTYTIDVGAAEANSIFSLSGDSSYTVQSISGGKGPLTPELGYGGTTVAPYTYIQNSGSQKTFNGITGATSVTSKAYNIIFWNGGTGCSTGSCTSGPSINFTGTSYVYSSGGSYSCGAQGTGAGCRASGPSNYGAGAGGGDSNGGHTSGATGLICIRYQ
jgi:hypothetical protein